VIGSAARDLRGKTAFIALFITFSMLLQIVPPTNHNPHLDELNSNPFVGKSSTEWIGV